MSQFLFGLLIGVIAACGVWGSVYIVTPMILLTIPCVIAIMTMVIQNWDK